MIKHFNDHAANERTYLAWARTSIAVMAFGFLVEKFDLFMKIVIKSLNVKSSQLASHTAEILGIVIMILAVIILLVASIRFIITKKQINTELTHAYNSKIPDIFLGILLTLITMSMVIYIWYLLW